MADYVAPVHQGYMDGLRGVDPKSRYEEYEAGWLAGAEDREAGVSPEVYEAPMFKRGDEVVIPKGTMLTCNMHPQGSTGDVVKRDTKITLHDYYPVQPAYINYGGGGRHGYIVMRPNPPEVVWAGAGGYWKHAPAKGVRKA